MVSVYTTTGKFLKSEQMPVIPNIGDKLFLRNDLFDKLDPVIKDRHPAAESPYLVVDRHIGFSGQVFLLIDPSKACFMETHWYVIWNSKGQRKELENIE